MAERGVERYNCLVQQGCLVGKGWRRDKLREPNWSDDLVMPTVRAAELLLVGGSNLVRVGQRDAEDKGSWMLG